eukprot:XP_011451183.2 PREDICTED: uncharacterized protein LOC105344953 [Crassostrea gigas]
MATCIGYYDEVEREMERRFFPREVIDEYQDSFYRQYGIIPNTAKPLLSDLTRQKKQREDALSIEKVLNRVKEYFREILKDSRKSIRSELLRGRLPNHILVKAKKLLDMFKAKRNYLKKMRPEQFLTLLNDYNITTEYLRQYMLDKPKHSAKEKTDLSWCVTKQKPELTSGNRKWDFSMDKLLKVEIEQEEDEEDDGFAPRKLFLSGIESFKPTPAKDEVQIMECKTIRLRR